MLVRRGCDHLITRCPCRDQTPAQHIITRLDQAGGIRPVRSSLCDEKEEEEVVVVVVGAGAVLVWSYHLFKSLYYSVDKATG